MNLGFRHTDFDTMIAGLMSTEMGLLAIMAAEAPDVLTPYVKDFLDNYGDKMGPNTRSKKNCSCSTSASAGEGFHARLPGHRDANHVDAV